MKRIAIALMVFLAPVVLAHHENISVLIDTDAAIDDLRAICMLLAMDEVEIVGIMVSDGACSPEVGARKVRALLKALEREDIPVVAGPTLDVEPPPWRSLCEAIPWGGEYDYEKLNTSEVQARLAGRILSSEEPIIVVCLGPLTNIADALRNEPAFAKNIECILWYNDDIDPPVGTNYERDPVAADAVLYSGIPIYVLSNTDPAALTFDEVMLAEVAKLNTPYAQVVAKAHQHPAAHQRLLQGHFKIWDELLPVWIRYPELFEMRTVQGRRRLQLCHDFDSEKIKEAILEILAGDGQSGNITFSRFPTDPLLYRQDLRAQMNEIIERHGEEEWRVCVITCELHGHLGIYSIVGAKMGLLAREILGANLDELDVLSFAGTSPPLSCFNDGLQVSTGATLGRGTITIEDTPSHRPEAIFTHNGRVLQLRLKKEYWDQVQSDLTEGVKRFGSGTPENWRYVRELGIRYWLEWDRREVFEEVEADM